CRREAGIEILVAEISVQNDQPPIIHEMSVFVTSQVPDLSGQLARKHNACRVGGLPERTRAYQIIGSLPMVLRPMDMMSFLSSGSRSIDRALDRAGSDSGSTGSAINRVFLPAFPPTLLNTQSNTTRSI